jgi:hypothetical protein
MTKAIWTAGHVSGPGYPVAVIVTRLAPAPAAQLASPKAQILPGEEAIPSWRVVTGDGRGVVVAGSAAGWSPSAPWERNPEEGVDRATPNPPRAKSVTAIPTKPKAGIPKLRARRHARRRFARRATRSDVVSPRAPDPGVRMAIFAMTSPHLEPPYR